jgi:Polyketide cyclase / dehydrase and lipid transport
VSHYTGVLEVDPRGNGSTVEWRAQFLANNQPDLAVKGIVTALLKTGLESLKPRFGAAT